MGTSHLGNSHMSLQWHYSCWHRAALTDWPRNLRRQQYLPRSSSAALCSPGVHCQTCHDGTEAHVAGRGMTKTTRAVDCRSYHDARHHLRFDQAKLWEVIRHGK